MKLVRIISFLLFAFGLNTINLNAQEQEDNTDNEGIALGFNLNLGATKYLQNSYLENSYIIHSSYQFSYSIDFDVAFYLSDVSAFKTGIGYGNDAGLIKDSISQASISVSTPYLTIPIKYMLTTGKNIFGFYLEAGLEAYIPFNTNAEYEGPVFDELNFEADGEFGIGFSCVAGLNILLQDRFSMHIAPTFDYIFGPDAIRFGGQVGVLYYLRK